MTHNKNLALCIAPNGYQIDLIKPSTYNEMIIQAQMNGQSVDNSECRSYGENLTEQQIEDLTARRASSLSPYSGRSPHTRIIFDVRYADGSVSRSGLEDVGFVHVGDFEEYDSGIEYSLFRGFGLKVEVNRFANIEKVYSEELDKSFNINTLPDLIRLTKFLEDK